jgi:hypothetical protein
MRKVRIRSMEDFDALPEGEWFEVRGGMKRKAGRAAIRIEDDHLVVPLPREVQAQFKASRGERLEARVSKGTLIVRHKAGKGTRRRARTRTTA